MSKKKYKKFMKKMQKQYKKEFKQLKEHQELLDQLEETRKMQEMLKPVVAYRVVTKDNTLPCGDDEGYLYIPEPKPNEITCINTYY